MRGTLFIAGALLVCSCAGPNATLPRIDISSFQPAVRAQMEPVYEAARANPKDADRVGKLGMMLEAYRQEDAAAQCYARAHQLAPKAQRWAYFLGRLKAGKGQTEEAIRLLDNQTASYAPASVALGNALINENRPRDAARYFETALRLAPDYAAAHYGLGRAWAQSGDTAKAVEQYRIAIGLFPNYGAAHYAIAQALRKQGDQSAAERELQEYEKNKTAVPPEDDPLRREIAELNSGAMAHLRKGAELEQAGQLQDAAAEQEQALQIDPSLVQAHVNLISLYGKLDQSEQAEAHFRKAVELDSRQADAYYNYGVLLFRRKQFSGAEQAFKDALSRNPHHAQAHHNLGFLYEQRGDLPLALKEYEAATASQPDYRLAHFHAGRILANQRRYDDAIAHLLKSITPEDESTPAYLYALAAAYARAGKREDAVKFATRARSGAVAMGQSELVAMIDKDFRR